MIDFPSSAQTILRFTGSLICRIHMHFMLYTTIAIAIRVHVTSTAISQVAYHQVKYTLLVIVWIAWGDYRWLL